MNENTILEQVNAYGAKLGWPFYVYPDGTCGKRLVSAGGTLNAAMFVKKKFPVRVLNSDFLTGKAGAEDDVLAHLCEVGDKLGYPLYVYADGTCGTTPVSPESKFPFTLVVKKKFTVNQMVLETEDSVLDVAADTGNTAGCAAGRKWQPEPLPQWTMTKRDKALLKAMRKGIQNFNAMKFDDEQSRAFFLFASDKEVGFSLLESKLFPEAAEKWLFLRGNAAFVREYLGKFSVADGNCPLLAAHYDDDVILSYVCKVVFSRRLTEELLIAGRFALLERIQEEVDLYAVDRLGRYSNHVTELIIDGHPELLKTQIRKYGRFRPTDVVLLLKSGNKEMIEYYLDYYALGEDGQKSLIELGDAALAQMYQKRYGFGDKARQLAEWRGLL